MNVNSPKKRTTKKPANTGCKLNTVTSRCVGYPGPDKMGCTKGPTGRCSLTTSLAKRYAPKRRVSPAQLAALARGRATAAANRNMRSALPFARQQQVGGGCRMGDSGRCKKVKGDSQAPCSQGPKRCQLTKNVVKAYAPKRQATQAQLNALAKGRATAAANRNMKSLSALPFARQQQVGGYWW
jgi:hypothetical protein